MHKVGNRNMKINFCHKRQYSTIRKKKEQIPRECFQFCFREICCSNLHEIWSRDKLATLIFTNLLIYTYSRISNRETFEYHFFTWMFT